MDMPLGPVDALILAQFSYFNFDHIVPGVAEQKPAVTMKELQQQADWGNLFSVDWFKEELHELFELLLKSRRYKSLRMNHFMNCVEVEKETQFSAITFTLGDGNVFIAFRGTDNELIGWKEDFNMAYLTPVPSQTMAVEYANQIAAIYKRKRKAKFYFGGHSKGGNLAVYAAMNCDKKLKDKIAVIYNMDGPGFRPEFFEGMDYESIQDRLRKFVPQSSVVGMFMQLDEHYEVIAGTVPGMMQHLPLTWRVDGTDFARVSGVNPKKKEVDDHFNDWILSMNKEDTEAFLECMYGLITSTNATSLKTLADNWLKNAFTMIGGYRKLDGTAKEIFWEMAGLFMKLFVVDSKEVVQRMGLLQTFKERIERSTGEGAQNTDPEKQKDTELLDKGI